MSASKYFRRHYKASNYVKVQIIGSVREGCRPYIRLEDSDGNYICSIDGVSMAWFRKGLDEAFRE